MRKGVRGACRKGAAKTEVDITEGKDRIHSLNPRLLDLLSPTFLKYFKEEKKIKQLGLEQ